MPLSDMEMTRKTGLPFVIYYFSLILKADGISRYLAHAELFAMVIFTGCLFLPIKK